MPQGQVTDINNQLEDAPHRKAGENNRYTRKGRHHKFHHPLYHSAHPSGWA